MFGDLNIADSLTRVSIQYCEQAHIAVNSALFGPFSHCFQHLNISIQQDRKQYVRDLSLELV